MKNYRYEALHLANSIIIHNQLNMHPNYHFSFSHIMQMCYLVLGNYLVIRDDDFFNDEVVVHCSGYIIPSVYYYLRPYVLIEKVKYIDMPKNKIKSALDIGHDDYDIFLGRLIQLVCNKFKGLGVIDISRMIEVEGSFWDKNVDKANRNKETIIFPKKQIRKVFKGDSQLLIDISKLK